MHSISYASARRSVLPVRKNVKSIVTWSIAKNAQKHAGNAQRFARWELRRETEEAESDK
jgi:hypothetical protein